MRILQLHVFLLITFSCFSQDSTPIRRIDTLLPFFGNKPMNLGGYENRTVPYNSDLPLYVMTTYLGGKSKNFEYFRTDSSHYLVYQFFHSDKGSSNRGLKSAGNIKVLETIVDSSYSTAISATNGHRSLYKRYYKGFAKEGRWDEYEDSLFFHKFWRGEYKDNQKIGVWSNYIYDPNEDRLVLQIDYDKDSTEKLFSVNLAGNLSLDSVKYFLNGRWTLGCEDDKDRRMLINKCQLYDGHYGDDCNNRFGNENYYEFFSNGDFKRQRGETCSAFKQNATKGKWNIYRSKGNLFTEIRLTNNSIIKYKVWYLDRDGNMIADRL